MSIDSFQIPETIIPGMRLGRHVYRDSRSAAFPAETAALASVTHATADLPLDQGKAGSCTGEALCGALNTAPHLGKGTPRTQADAYSIYSAEQIALGYGPYPPNDNGGSGTEVCKVAQKRGWLRGYTHATDINSALGALVVRPVITGVNWYTSFDTPTNEDGQYLISIGKKATVRGGHEFLVFGINVSGELVYCMQSWGPGYGNNGVFAMSFSTWGTLLEQDGDVTVPLTTAGWNP